MSDPNDHEDDYDDMPVLYECDHENANIDILEGRLLCHCGYSRYLSGEELWREHYCGRRMAPR